MTYAEQVAIFENTNFYDPHFDTPLDSLDKLEEDLYADKSTPEADYQDLSVEEDVIELSGYEAEILNCINAMKEEEALGQVFIFTRDENNFLNSEPLDLHSGEDLDYGNLNQYEMIIFDGGTTYGDAWKKVFIPNQKQHFTIYES